MIELRTMKYRRAARLLALLLALLCLLPSLSAYADETCTLKVNPSANEEIKTDLGTDFAYDLYLVAVGTPDGVSDAYTYALTQAFNSLTLPDAVLDPASEDAAADARSVWEAWRELSQKAAGVVKGATTPLDKVTEAQLVPGLYLIVAHKKDAAPEWVEKTVQGSGSTDDSTVLYTKIKTASYDYLFAPELVALPTKEQTTEVKDADDNLIGSYFNTADNSAWLWDVTVNLKPIRDEGKGSLLIKKSLTGYRGPYDATFVFDIKAVLDGEVVYSNVVSLNFNSSGEKTYLLEDAIPVGAVVTVTEVYSGAHYQVTQSTVGNLVITADEVVTAAFTNSDDDTNTGGGGIINQFTLTQKGTDNKGDNWKWDPLTGDDINSQGAGSASQGGAGE